MCNKFVDFYDLVLNVDIIVVDKKRKFLYLLDSFVK